VLEPNTEAFNVREDLESANLVFEKLQGVVPFVLLGKHAAYQVGLEKKHFSVHSVESQVREILGAFRKSDREHFNRVYPIPKEKDTDEGWYDALTIVSHPYDPLLILYLIRPELFEPEFIGVAKSAPTNSFNPSYPSSSSSNDLSFPLSTSNLFQFNHTLIGNTAELHGIPNADVVRKFLIERMNAGLQFVES